MGEFLPHSPATARPRSVSRRRISPSSVSQYSIETGTRGSICGMFARSPVWPGPHRQHLLDEVAPDVADAAASAPTSPRESCGRWQRSPRVGTPRRAKKRATCSRRSAECRQRGSACQRGRASVAGPTAFIVTPLGDGKPRPLPEDSAADSLAARDAHVYTRTQSVCQRSLLSARGTLFAGECRVCAVDTGLEWDALPMAGILCVRQLSRTLGRCSPSHF